MEYSNHMQQSVDLPYDFLCSRINHHDEILFIGSFKNDLVAFHAFQFISKNNSQFFSFQTVFCHLTKEKATRRDISDKIQSPSAHYSTSKYIYQHYLELSVVYLLIFVPRIMI